MDAVEGKQSELASMRDKLARTAQRIHSEKAKEQDLVAELGDAILADDSKAEKAAREKIANQQALIETLELSQRATETKAAALLENIAAAERERAAARQVTLKAEYDRIMLDYTKHLWEIWQLSQRIDSLYREDESYVQRFALRSVTPIKSTSIGEANAEEIFHVCLRLIEKKMPDIFKQSGAFSLSERQSIRKYKISFA